MLRTLVFCGLVASCLALVPFSFENCTTGPNPLVRIEHVSLSVDPIRFPGDVTGSVDIIILNPITGSDHQVQVHLQKKFLNGYVDVPCIAGVGSCTYKLCEVLQNVTAPYASDPHHCPSQIASTSPDFQCVCPFQPGTYRLNPSTVHIAEPTGAFKFAAQGDYRAKLRVIDTSNNNEEVGCFVAYVSTVTDCTGISCIIG